MLPSAYALPEIIKKAVDKEIDNFFLIFFSFMILFSVCKITQSPMQPIYKDEAETLSLKKIYFRKYHLDNTPCRLF